MDQQQATNQFELWAENLQVALTAWGPKLVAAAVILILGFLIAKMATGLIARGMRKIGLDETLVRFLGNIVRVLLYAFVLIASLGKLGVDTTSLAAILAAAGLAIGLALQGSLGNFASGVLLIATRPFKVGDFVTVGGVSGTVEEINVFATRLNTPDNISLIVPNGKITDAVITNVNGNATRRIDMIFGIAYTDDIDKARAIFVRVVEAHPKVLRDPAPRIAVHTLADSSVNFVVRPWVETSDYFGTLCELTEQIKKACDEGGISIPFPQRDVHLHQVKSVS